MTVRIWMNESDAGTAPVTYYDVEYIATGPSLVQLFDKNNATLGAYNRRVIASMTVNK